MSLGMRLLAKIIMKLLERVKRKTWKKFIFRKRQKFCWVKICLINRDHGGPGEILLTLWEKVFLGASLVGSRGSRGTCQCKGWPRQEEPWSQQQPENWVKFPHYRSEGHRKGSYQWCHLANFNKLKVTFVSSENLCQPCW